MTSSEENYSQLEKQILSIVFACERFNAFLYGQDFLVLNDHKPLQALFQKPILKAPPRIQRFLLSLQKYRFTMQIQPRRCWHVSVWTHLAVHIFRTHQHQR